MSKWVAAIACLVTALVFAPLAHADDDAWYIDWLYQHNLGCGQGSIRCSTPADLVVISKSVCTNIDVGGDDLLGAVTRLHPVGDNLPEGQPISPGNPLVNFAIASITMYCPLDNYLIGG